MAGALPKPKVRPGDHVRIGRVVHVAVYAHVGPEGGQTWINKMRTACRSTWFSEYRKRRTEEAATCLPCLMETSNAVHDD